LPLVNVVLPLISAFVVAHKIPLLVKVYCSGIVSRVVGLLYRRGFKGAYGLSSNTISRLN
jgi:hypothetical protein